jgi:hypothetical protein
MLDGFSQLGVDRDRFAEVGLHNREMSSTSSKVIAVAAFGQTWIEEEGRSTVSWAATSRCR